MLSRESPCWQFFLWGQSSLNIYYLWFVWRVLFEAAQKLEPNKNEKPEDLASVKERGVAIYIKCGDMCALENANKQAMNTVYLKR